MEGTTRILKIELYPTSEKLYCEDKMSASLSNKVGHLAENSAARRQSHDAHQHPTVASWR
jgi:hypothetical protein